MSNIMSNSIISEFMSNISIIDSDSSEQKSINSNHPYPKITYIIEPSGAKFDEAKRVIAIAYSYDQNKNVKYGASIFRKINKNDICIKSQIRETALDRFNKYPVCFSLSDTTNKIKYDEVVKQIRYKMYKYGVQGREPIYSSLTNLDSEIESNTQNENLVESKYINFSQYVEPRISYIIEPKYSNWHNAKRIIAIAYSYYSNEISYAACIFKRNFPNETCVKANIRNTALDRFFKEPIVLYKKNPDNNKLSVPVVLETIRKIMYKEGVKKNRNHFEK